MATINTTYIKTHILSQYDNGNDMVRLSKRKFEYNNDQLFDYCGNTVTDPNNDVIVLNGKLNWRCYACPDDDTSIFVVDNGTDVLYHGELSAAIPLSAFNVTIHCDNSGCLLSTDEYDSSSYISLFLTLNVDLDSSGIYGDDIRPEHVAGLNHIKTVNVENIDAPMENFIWVYFDKTLVHDDLISLASEYHNYLKSVGFKKVSIVNVN